MKTSMCVVMVVAAMVAPQRDVQVLKLATGEVLAFPFPHGIPVPAESAWAVCRGAGPSFTQEAEGIRLGWAVGLGPKSRKFRDVVSVKLQEVSGSEAVTLFTGPAKVDKDSLMIIAKGEIVSRSTYSWLYSDDRTVLVIRVELERPGEKDVLNQPVLIGPDVKKKLRDVGYLR